MRSRGTALVMLLLACGIAVAAAAGHDTRALTAAERQTFIALLCRTPVADKDGGNRCAAVIGYPGAHAGGEATLALDAIAYGGFTAAGADEAYISYSSSLEPHANNFGGGALLARAGALWSVVAWYPGGQMDECLALPGDGPQRMLCRAGYVGMGEVDSSVWINQVAKPDATVAVLKAQDRRGAGDPDDPHPFACDAMPAQAVLLSIGRLHRSMAAGSFAAAAVRYVSAEAVGRACRRHFAHVTVTQGTVRFVLRDGMVTALTPVRFAPTDY